MCLIEVGGSDDGSARVRKMLQSLDEVEGTGSILPRRRFVEEQDARIPEHVDPDADSPTLFSGASGLLESVPDAGVGLGSGG